MKLYVDTTTDTGIWLWNHPDDDPKQPHLIRFAAILENAQGEEVDRVCRLVTPLAGWPSIEPRFTLMHGIDSNDLQEHGVVLSAVLARVWSLTAKSGAIVAHNVDFHQRVLQRTLLDGKGFAAAEVKNPLEGMDAICTMRSATDFVRIRQSGKNHFKWPSLGEAYLHFVGHALSLPSDPIARGFARVEAVRDVHHGILAATTLPAA